MVVFTDVVAGVGKQNCGVNVGQVFVPTGIDPGKDGIRERA